MFVTITQKQWNVAGFFFLLITRITITTFFKKSIKCRYSPKKRITKMKQLQSFILQTFLYQVFICCSVYHRAFGYAHLQKETISLDVQKGMVISHWMLKQECIN